MAGTFKQWMISKGYQRKLNSLVWWKNGDVISVKELNNRMNEFDKLK